MAIAIGIGLHNFSKGLAIGQTATAGEISLPVLLIIGFALHNATEGSASSGRWRPPTSRRRGAGWAGRADRRRPDLPGHGRGDQVRLGLCLVGCPALAAGAILYVLGELLPVGRRLSWEVTL
jgi:zinc transporter, ZIP family